MPKLIQTTAGVAQGGYAMQQASAQDFGGMEAQVLGQIGKMFQQAQEKRDRVEYQKQISQFRFDSMRRAQEINQSDLPKGKTLIDVYEEDFAKRSNELKIPSSMKQEWAAQSAELRLSYTADALVESRRRVEIQAKDAYETIVTSSANAVAMNPALQGQSLASLEAAVQDLPFSPELRASLLKDGRQKIRSNAAQAIITKSPGAFLEQAKAGQWNDLDDLSKYLAGADNEIKRGNAGAKAALNDEIRLVDTAKSIGKFIPKDKLSSLAERADMLGDTKTAQKLRDYSIVQDKAFAFAQMPLNEQQAELENIDRKFESGDLSVVNEYKTLSNVLETKIKMIQSGDAWSYYAEHGVVKRPQEIQNFADPQEISAAVSARKPDIQVIRDRENMALPLFTKGEIERLKETVGGDVKAAGAVLSAVGGSLDENQARSLAKQISKDVPVVAVAMTVPPKVGKEILEGTKAKGDVSQQKVRAAINEKIKGIVFGVEDNEAIHASAYALYKQRALVAGDTSPEVDDKILKTVIEDVVGRPASFNLRPFGKNSNVFLYRDETGEFVKESKLKSLLSGITDEKLIAVAGGLPMTSDGVNVSAKEMLEYASFISSGDGEYTPVIKDLGILVDKSGNKYKINARALDGLR